MTFDGLGLEERKTLKPPERISVCEWVERFRELSLATSAESGKLRLSRTPFLRPVLESFGDKNIQEIVICSSAQIGKTTALENMIAFSATQDPGPTMMFFADQNTSEEMSETRIRPMFRTIPALAEGIIENKFNKTSIRLKNSYYILMAWASSIAQTASRSIRYLFLDEIDKPGYGVVGCEGSTLHRLEQRTETFANRKIIKCSTPTDETGNILKELEKCDVIYDWHVPCPHCGFFQPLRWKKQPFRHESGVEMETGMIVFQENNPETARYQCSQCGKLWNTVEKGLAVEKGKMISRRSEPDKKKRVGYHFNRIYSLFDGGRLEKMVEDWLKVKDIADDLKSFINSALAEPWVIRVEKPEEKEILDAKCDLLPWHVPETAIALTMSVDVQKVGFWYLVRAWARDLTSWLVCYGFAGTWLEIEQIAFETNFPVVQDLNVSARNQQEKKIMKIWRGMVDIGGARRDTGNLTTEEVYTWLRRNRGRGAMFWGSKGSSESLEGLIKIGQPIDKTPSGRPCGLQIVSMDTNKLKDAYHFHLRLAREKVPGGGYLHSKTEHDYARQIMAEEKIRNDKGFEEWVCRGHKDNHYLDCEVMARAMVDETLLGGIMAIRRPDAKPKEAQRKLNSSDSLSPSGWLGDLSGWNK